MKKDLSVIILIAVFLVGLALVLYPTVANTWNQRTQSKAIAVYETVLSDMTRADYDDLYLAAEEYNRSLSRLELPLVQYSKVAGYEDLLNVSGNGIMGYVTIEKIKVELPIYHGISDEVLNCAVGHLPGSSLPVGGIGSHAVLSAHRGLPSAKLFSDLDKLQVGDTFTVTTVDRLLTYEIDQILIVRPSEIEALAADPGKDYCTLVTCTPYGINTHRLLVRGKRTENAIKKPAIYVSSNVYRIDPIIITPLVAAPMLLVLLIILLVRYRKGKR